MSNNLLKGGAIASFDNDEAEVYDKRTIHLRIGSHVSLEFDSLLFMFNNPSLDYILNEPMRLSPDEKFEKSITLMINESIDKELVLEKVVLVKVKPENHSELKLELIPQPETDTEIIGNLIEFETDGEKPKRARVIRW